MNIRFIFQVADIEEKLDMLIKAYMQDRDRFSALPQNIETNFKDPPPPPQPPPKSGIAGILISNSSMVRKNNENELIISEVHFKYTRVNISAETCIDRKTVVRTKLTNNQRIRSIDGTRNINSNRKKNSRAVSRGAINTV